MNRKLKVMVVENSSSLLNLIGQTLRNGGFDVIEAGDGEQALEQLQLGEVDLLISDVNMSRPDGIELATLVRRLPGMSLLPIILIAGEGDDKRALAKQASPSGWISKPFHPEKLLNVTRTVLGHA